MKQLFLSLLLTGVFFTSDAQTDSTKFDFNEPSIQEIEQRLQGAGMHLRKFQNQYLYGVIMGLAGVAFAANPLYIDWEYPEVPAIMGSVLCVTGAIIMIDAHKHINKAGLSLQGNGISMRIGE